MLILGINKICDWVQITTGGRKYTCPMKSINGELFFAFKKSWHPVAKYVTKTANVLLNEGGRIVSKPYK